MKANPSSWVERFGDVLFSIALLKTNNRETAEDLVQDTFLSAIRALDNFKGESSEKTWLISILNNKIIDYYRKKDPLKNTEQYLQETEQSFSDNFFENDGKWAGHWLSEAMPKAWSAHADEDIIQADFYRILEMCIAKMPPKLATIFISKYIDENDAEKICKDFEISSSNYWVMIHRSKILMRSCLENNWVKP